MKFSNFVKTKEIGVNLSKRKFYAEVDVESGILWFRKVCRREVCREYAGYWYYTDTGKFILPGQIEEQARIWNARTGDRI